MKSADHRAWIPISFYAGGTLGSWLAMTWSGFTEFPFREIGALVWPLLAFAILFVD